MNTTDIIFSSNKVKDVEKTFLDRLQHLYPEGEIKMFVRMLFEAFLGWNQVRLLISKEETVNQSDLLRFHWALKDLERFRPIQHIIGHTDFCGYRIEVDESVLIPRPETEEIVQHIFHILADNPPRRILDLCTGSGCIAIAMKKRWPEAEVTAIDNSTKALEKASHNAQNNDVEIRFINADVLNLDTSIVLGNSNWDLIVSNPPYIRVMERWSMQRNVLEYEPHEALFVPDEQPLIFYKAIIDIASDYLTVNGKLALEINEALGDTLLDMLRGNGFHGERGVNLHKDFRGKDRFIISTKKRWKNEVTTTSSNEITDGDYLDNAFFL